MNKGRRHPRTFFRGAPPLCATSASSLLNSLKQWFEGIDPETRSWCLHLADFAPGTGDPATADPALLPTLQKDATTWAIELANKLGAR